MTTETPTREEGIEKMQALMKDITFCMLTSVDSGGVLHSRPMTLQHVAFDGTLWFFVGLSTGVSREIVERPQVNVSFSAPADHQFVSASGRARLVQDPVKKEALWNPTYKVWFPGGLADPELVLLAVDIENAEYWDSSNGIMTVLIGMIKAFVAGKSAPTGEHQKLTL